ncbi:hypothetical protein [Comamonas sp. CMM02]|uniref:hypothetical protein n=1 Tax=Comamonas sp. CMM02 TaxID=2769307 RepID=UPI00177F9D14|nr:hypothetical protein [Comamonas sp. CMM02]MBD9400992.1 hypothetical protein [Comamonas sp. CMM02]
MSFQFTSIRRVLAGVCLVALALPASASCTIYRETSSPQVDKAFSANNGYTFKKYHEVCEKLRKADAKIVIHGSSGVLVNRSYGWASISVADKANSNLVINSFSGYSTNLNDYASSDQAQQSLWIAINYGLENWEKLDEALAELRQVRAQMRKPASRK